MDDAIRVHVVDKGRKNLYMRYRCPLTGRDETRSTGTAKQKEAVKVAAKWEAELQEGRYQKSSRMTWAEFRDYYERHHLDGLAGGTAATYAATLNKFEQHCRPGRLSDISAAMISEFITHERRAGSEESTLGRHVRTLRAILNWSVDQGLLAGAPKLKAPKRARQSREMKGRAITGEEFDRLLRVAVKKNPDAAVWDFYLRGLWWSGLRLRESLPLSWTPRAGVISVDLDGKYPVFRVPAEAEKGNRDRRLPMAPEFAEMLHSVPERLRRGRVFGVPCDRHSVGRRISRIGAASGIVTEPDTGKTATAHDLRRSFGLRWAMKVMPAALMKLMRHSTIETTMKYYVGLDADETSAQLYAALGDTLGDTRPQTGQLVASAIDANPVGE